MTTDLFGNPHREVDSRGRCLHVNAHYKLPLYGSVELESRVEGIRDRVEESARSLSWDGSVTGRCRDCGKPFFYSASTVPKFVKRRLSLAFVEGPGGENLIEKGV